MLLVGKDEAGQPWLSSSEISQILVEVCEIAVTRQAVEAALKTAKGLVCRQRISNGIRYSIMAKGRDALLSSFRHSVLVIQPEKALSGIRALEEVFARLQGEIRICDPYVDSKTLDFLTAIPKTSRIRLLTVNLQDVGRLRRDFKAYNRERGNLEIRVATGSKLHDRYIISDNTMYLVGQSLNGIGSKQTFVVSVGHDIAQQTTRTFDGSWGAANPFI